MPDHPNHKAGQLEKLGPRLRDGFALEHPTPHRCLETVRQTIREQWEIERKAKGQQPPPPTPAKERQSKPEATEPER